MGPRPAGRGRLRVCSDPHAESAELQWGRGRPAAEGWPRCGPRRYERGSFNGAAAGRPRKVDTNAVLGEQQFRFNGAAAGRPRKGK